MQRSKAFTLIELLVVIAIIAILAAILFPVFAQAKLAAKKTVALSNAKQIATANMIYMGDYDDSLVKCFYGFPADGNWGATNGWDYYGWRHALAPYTKSTGLMTDTTNPFVGESFWVDLYTDSAGKNYKYSTNFAVNNHVIGFANGTVAGPWTPVGRNSLSEVDEPAGTIIMMPSRTRWNDMKISFLSHMEAKNAGDPPNSWCIVPNGGSATNCPGGENGPIHSVGKSTAFVWADGHAKAKNPLATADANNPNRDDWATQGQLNPRTNANWTQADRQQIVADAWGEYK